MHDANKWNLSNAKSFIQQLFDTAISFNSVIDLPEVLYDAWRDCRFSTATLVYIDNDGLNIYDRSLERLVLVRT